MADTLDGYCHRCEAEREILVTVPWQEDSCIECGSTDVTTQVEAA